MREGMYEGPESDPEPKLPQVDLPKIFNQINELLFNIQSSYPELVLRLYLQCSQVINNVSNNRDLEEISYDFISAALIVYQDEIADSD